MLTPQTHLIYVFGSSHYFQPNIPRSNCDGRLNICVLEMSLSECQTNKQSYVGALVFLRHIYSRSVRIPLFIAYISYFVSVSICESMEPTTFVPDIFSDFPCNKIVRHSERIDLSAAVKIQISRKSELKSEKNFRTNIRIV